MKKITNPKLIGLLLGPVLFLGTSLMPTPEGLSIHGKFVLAISFWMIIWWITEAISVYATALLPLGLMPVTGVLPLKDVATEYMHPIIVLLLGMFLIALAIEKTGLHRKIAFQLITVFGYSPRRIVLGFMISTAVISTVIMSTTVVLIMLPISFVVLNALSKHNLSVSPKFKLALMLGMAYSSSIGSVSTLIGAPPNLIFAGAVNELFSHTVTFGEWSSIGVPLSVIMLTITSWYITKGISKESINENDIKKIIFLESERIGKIRKQQVVVLGVLLLVLMLMFTSPIWLPTDSFITNSVIAVLGGLSLFALPATRSQGLLEWAEVERLPFGILFLLGGGLALALAFVNSGLATWIANSLSFVSFLPFEVTVILVVSIIMFMSNVKSNTSTAAIFIPIVANMAILNHWSPLPILFGITIASSFAFLLPMGTPPNALVYDKGKVTIKEMFKSGIILNFISIALISFFTIFISPLILN